MRFNYYHMQKFSQEDGGSDSELIITTGHNFNKTLQWGTWVYDSTVVKPWHLKNLKITQGKSSGAHL